MPEKKKISAKEEKKLDPQPDPYLEGIMGKLEKGRETLPPLPTDEDETEC